MLSILGFLTGLGPLIAQVSNKILELRMKQTESKSDVEKAKISAELEALHDRKAVLIAEAGNKFSATCNNIVRTTIGLSVAIFISKVFVWDKTLGSLVGCSGRLTDALKQACSTFTTDGLDPTLAGLVVAVSAFYLLATKQ